MELSHIALGYVVFCFVILVCPFGLPLQRDKAQKRKSLFLHPFPASVPYLGPGTLLERKGTNCALEVILLVQRHFYNYRNWRVKPLLSNLDFFGVSVRVFFSWIVKKIFCSELVLVHVRVTIERNTFMVSYSVMHYCASHICLKPNSNQNKFGLRNYHWQLGKICQIKVKTLKMSTLLKASIC